MVQLLIWAIILHGNKENLVKVDDGQWKRQAKNNGVTDELKFDFETSYSYCSLLCRRHLVGIYLDGFCMSKLPVYNYKVF